MQQERPGAAGGVLRDIEALTGLRAVAAGWVVLLHYQWLLAPYLAQVPLLRSVVSAGWLGVDVFFVLSGYVIGLSYLETVGDRPRPRTAVRFLCARFARVWPAWAVVTVGMAGWIWSVRRSGHNADVVLLHPAADVKQLLLQLSMVHMWGRGTFTQSSFDLPGWSISAEWLAYLAFPLLAVLLWRFRRLPAVVLVALACAASAPLALSAFEHGVVDAQQSWLMRIGCGFTAGLLTALAARRIRPSARVESLALATSVLVPVLVGAVLLWNTWRRGGDLTHDYAGVVVPAFPLLVLGLTFTRRGPAALLSRRPLVYGGKLSYCVYLVHFTVMDVVCTVLWQDPRQVYVPTPGVELAVPFMVASSLGLAWLLHHGVEEPARRRVMARVDAWLPARPRAAAVEVPARPVPLVAHGRAVRRVPVPRVVGAASGHRLFAGERPVAPEPATERLQAVPAADGAPRTVVREAVRPPVRPSVARPEPPLPRTVGQRS